MSYTFEILAETIKKIKRLSRDEYRDRTKYSSEELQNFIEIEFFVERYNFKMIEVIFHSNSSGLWIFTSIGRDYGR